MQDSVFLSLKQNPFHFPIDLNVPQWEQQITTNPRFSPFRTLSSSPELDRSNMFLISGLLIWLLHPSPALPAFPTFLSVFFVWFSHSSFDFDSVGYRVGRKIGRDIDSLTIHAAKHTIMVFYSDRSRAEINGNLYANDFVECLWPSSG